MKHYHAPLSIFILQIVAILFVLAMATQGQSSAILATSSTPSVPNLLEIDEMTMLALQASENGQYVGQVIAPPIKVQDFLLPSSLGDETHLSDLEGTWRVIFFGYMRCPDFCPLTLVEYREVKALLEKQSELVTFVFVSVDATRDTPEALQTYLENFDPEFVGFSGDDETLAQIQPDYGFYYAKRLASGKQSVYTIDHSTRSYLVDPQGILRASFAYNSEPSDITSALRWYIQQFEQIN